MRNPNFAGEMARCGLDCGRCDWKERCGCPGCHAAQGHMFHGECPISLCSIEKGLDHCGACADLPCAALLKYATDPEHGDPEGSRIQALRSAMASPLRHGVITSSRAAEYPNPLHLHAQQTVTLGVESNSASWKNWIWCVTENNAGWAPLQLFRRTAPNSGIALEDYDATELSVTAGERFVSERVLNGWHWGYRLEEPHKKGWVPMEQVQIEE